MYAAMSENWPGSGIVVSYKKQGFEECLGNVMMFNSLLEQDQILCVICLFNVYVLYFFLLILYCDY